LRPTLIAAVILLQLSCADSSGARTAPQTSPSLGARTGQQSEHEPASQQGTSSSGSAEEGSPAGAASALDPSQAAVSGIRADEFGRTCSADVDCVAIIEGDCSVEQCANAAIRRDELGAYRSRCSGTRDPLAECEYEVGEPALCRAGRCTVRDD
jgi:hypothetical protein